MHMKESIFSTIVRTFFVSLFAMLGIAIGLVLLIAIIAVFSEGTSTTEPSSHFSTTILPNAEGVRKTQSKETPVILQISIDGIIGSDELNMSSIRRLLVESREGDFKDNRVKGILLRINSPGGTVVDSDGIYRSIKTYKDQYKVPVYAYVDGLCASGGMYVAAAADKIYASDVSLIGSIGVVSPAFFNVTDLIDKLGVKALTLTAGKDKDILNPLRPWKPDEQESIQQIINYYYQHFVNVVTSNRPDVDKTKLVDDYGAKIFNPMQAKEIGFITESGFSLRETLQHLVEALDIKDNKYQVVELKHQDWFSELFKANSSLLQGTVTHKVELPTELDPKFNNQFLYLYRP